MFLHEDMMSLLMCGQKWSEAVSTVHQLLRERSSSAVSIGSTTTVPESLGSAQARQHFLLASIYYDRYMSNAGAPLSSTINDIEKAEDHAMEAFTRQWNAPVAADQPAAEARQQSDCIELFARILETRDKTVEATNLRKLLSEQPGSSTASDSFRRISTHVRSHDEFDVVDEHEILVEAIQHGDTDQIHQMLAMNPKLEGLCSKGKTFLMHAVEKSDESTVHKLLGPDHQADVNTAGKGGLTALHYAAMGGLNDMARCLLSHDAEVDPLDKRGQAPVVKAVIAGHTTMVEAFFQWDETSLQFKNREERSLLHYAVRESGKEMIDLLLELAPDLKDAVDRAGKTALHHCAENDWLDPAMALLDNEMFSKSDVNATDSVSRNALYFAASRPPTELRERFVKLLISKGAVVEANKPPPRMRDYIAFRKPVPRRDSAMSRTSVSTSGMTATTTSSSGSRFSRMIGRIGMRN